ncbi:MAG TPA: helix-turn-helix domain-containing protein [Deltaproteobacteria bacterium]|nr:helix-turn-helix domain-containing protein [Deltaproteobacteria bacterium]
MVKPSFHQILSNMTRPPSPELPSLRPVRTRYLAEVERFYLTELMKRTDGNVSTACRISGLSRSRLYALLHKYEVSRHM